MHDYLLACPQTRTAHSCAHLLAHMHMRPHAHTHACTRAHRSANNFERNMKDMFRIKAVDIGDLEHVIIRKDNSGLLGSDWHLQVGAAPCCAADVACCMQPGAETLLVLPGSHLCPAGLLPCTAAPPLATCPASTPLLRDHSAHLPSLLVAVKICSPAASLPESMCHCPHLRGATCLLSTHSAECGGDAPADQEARLPHLQRLAEGEVCYTALRDCSSSTTNTHAHAQAHECAHARANARACAHKHTQPHSGRV